MAAVSSCSFSGSTLAVASSRMMMGAFFSITRAMAMRCLNGLLIRCALVSHADILQNGCIKKAVILGYIGDALVVVLLRHGADIHAAHGNAAPVQIPQTGDQLGNGGFSAAG